MVHYSLNWTGLHVLVAHILIVMLFAAPSLVIVSMGVSPEKKRIFLGSALAIMVLGTAATFIAFATGETAVKALGSGPALKAALEAHRAFAETTRELFCVLTMVFAALLFAPRLSGHQLQSRINTALLAIYLLFYATGALFLVHTALQGGQVVHALGPKTAAVSQWQAKESAR